MKGIKVSVAVPLSKQEARPSSFRAPRSVNQPDQFMTVTLRCDPVFIGTGLNPAEVDAVAVQFSISSPNAPLVSFNAAAEGYEEDGTYLSDQDLVFNDGVAPGEDPIPDIAITFPRTFPPSVTRVCLNVMGNRLQPFPFGGPRLFPFVISNLCTPQNLDLNLACNT
jgi:hypothetical protein